MRKMLLGIFAVMSAVFVGMPLASGAESIGFRSDLIPMDVGLKALEILGSPKLAKLSNMPYEILLNDSKTTISVEDSQVKIGGRLKFSPTFGSNFVPIMDLTEPDNFLKEGLLDSEGDVVERYPDTKIEIDKIHSVACFLIQEPRTGAVPFVRKPDSEEAYTMVDRVQAYGEDPLQLLGEISDNRSIFENKEIMFVLPGHATSGVYLGRCALFVSAKISDEGYGSKPFVEIAEVMYFSNNFPSVRFEVISSKPDNFAPSIESISFNGVRVVNGSTHNPSKISYFGNTPQKFKITAKGYDDVLGLKDIMLSFFYITKTEREVHMHLKKSEANCTSKQVEYKKEVPLTRGDGFELSRVSWECTWDVDFNNEIPEKGFVHLYDGYVADDFRLKPVCRGKYNSLGGTSETSSVCYATFLFERMEPFRRSFQRTKEFFPIRPKASPNRDYFFPRDFR